MTTPSSHPPIPPRPARTKSSEGPASTDAAPSVPSIPPRPQNRRNQHSDNVPASTSNVSPSVELQMPVPLSTSADAQSIAPTVTEPPRSTSTLSNYSDAGYDKGIPVIGRRVPMYPNAGDVQAPTPAPGTETPTRKLNAVYKPPNFGEYSTPGMNHRVSRNAFAMSSEDLSQAVHKSLGGAGLGTKGGQPVPDEDMGYYAAEQILSPGAEKRMSVELPPPTDRRVSAHGFGSAASVVSGYGHEDDYEDELHAEGTPILASDEVRRSGINTPAYQYPAVTPPLSPHRTPAASKAASIRSRRGSNFSNADVDELNLKKVTSPLNPEDHEPLFPEESDKKADSEPAVPVRPSLKRLNSKGEISTQRFPSRDVWEDAPSSSLLEATVIGATPGKEERLTEQDEESLRLPVVPRSGTATPMHINSVTGYSTPPDHDINYLPPRPSIRSSSRESTRSSRRQKFPSKDTWEDAPDSHHLTTTVTPAPFESETEPAEDPSSESIPTPQIPAAAAVSKDPASVISTPSPTDSKPKEKPPVAKKPPIPPPPPKKPTTHNPHLRAGDNSRLARGPKPAEPEPKKEEEAPKPVEPLVDVRKGRARGPQRRAPQVKKEEKVGVQGGVNQIMGVWVIWEVAEEEEEQNVVAEIKPEEEEKGEKEGVPSVPDEKVVEAVEDVENKTSAADVVVEEKHTEAIPPTEEKLPEEHKFLEKPTESSTAKEVLEAADRG